MKKLDGILLLQGPSGTRKSNSSLISVSFSFFKLISGLSSDGPVPFRSSRLHVG